ncbi:FUSC family protein [Undibacterium sp. SXout11W]|uniref:FUSC family protein n=1 Tax=Undibacterium sp. SXout11W TaxID=3413050 RepID=UPI003BF18F40
MLNLHHLLRPFPGRLEFAIRAALICVFTTFAVEYYQTPEAALTVYLVFFLLKPDRVGSIIQSIAILVLFSLVIGIVFLITMVVIDEPILRVACMALISFFLLFATSASKLRPVGATLALVIVYSLDLIGHVQIGELATRALLYAWLIAGIPAVICIIVNLLIGPAPRRLAEKALAQRLMLAAAVLRSGHDKAHEFEQIVREGTEGVSKYLKFASLEKTSSAEDIARLNHFTVSITPLLLIVDLIRKNHPDLLPDSMKEYFSQALNAIASTINAGEFPDEFHADIRPAKTPLSPCGQDIVKELSAALNHLTSSDHAHLQVEKSKAHAAPVKSGFFVTDAFSNPEHVRYALKTTGAAMACYLIYSALSWPGIHTCLITCYVVALGTTGETLEKLRLRVLGCLVGAIAGFSAILFIMPDINAISSQLVVVFLGALLSAWVAGGHAKISYAGLQIAFAFFMCVIQGDSPSFNMVSIRDRVIGILFGNLVVHLVYTYVWPTTIAARVDAALDAIIKQMGELRFDNTSTAIDLQMSTARAALSNIERDLEVLRFEPESIRPASDWIDARQQTTHQIALLMGCLLISIKRNAGIPSHISSRLQRLSEMSTAIASPNPNENARHVVNASALTTHDLLEIHMRDLEISNAQRFAQDNRMKEYASA